MGSILVAAVFKYRSALEKVSPGAIKFVSVRMQTNDPALKRLLIGQQ
jgi:hypothetical protein